MAYDERTIKLNMKEVVTVSSADAPRAACLIVIAGVQAGRIFKLERKAAVLGRHPNATFVIEDEGVSRRHAQVSFGPENTLILTDLNSTNGTFRNGERITRCQLADGDKVQLGQATILKFSYQDAVEEEFAMRQYSSSTRDALTGCYNKHYFNERMPNELAFARRNDKMLSLAVLDLDHFKQINDTHGHPAGDKILRETAQITQTVIRRGDVLVRYGGEEFALIMREASANDAHLVAERIRRAVETARFIYEGKQIPVTVSIGIATYAKGSPDNDRDLLRVADERLYWAKQNGRNRTVSGLTA
jgi:diguanylate cyclase (GGDEF)-like protein